MFLKLCKIVFCLLCLKQMHGALLFCTDDISIIQQPVAMAINPGPYYTLINSVDFHPKNNLFCVTCTHSNSVVLYKIDAAGNPVLFQKLFNPSSRLSEPQHAVFSPNGEKLVVANWTNQTLTIYKHEKNGFFCKTPAAVIPPPPSLLRHKPHGIALSPCGNFLAIAYGAASYHERAIALFRMTNDGMGCELEDLLQGDTMLLGIPKGVAFSPDGTCLLVTFSDVNSLAIFDLDKENHIILPTPRQVFQGQETGISRPEDVKISPDGNYCAISNSDLNTVTFYHFNKTSNYITQNAPCCSLQNPGAQLHFPHGLAFSPDGSFLLVTEFGPIKETKEGDLFWNNSMPANLARVNIYKISYK